MGKILGAGSKFVGTLWVKRIMFMGSIGNKNDNADTHTHTHSEEVTVGWSLKWDRESRRVSVKDVGKVQFCVVVTSRTLYILISQGISEICDC